MNQDDPRKGIFLDIVKINEKHKGNKKETKFIYQF